MGTARPNARQVRDGRSRTQTPLCMFEAARLTTLRTPNYHSYLHVSQRPYGKLVCCQQVLRYGVVPRMRDRKQARDAQLLRKRRAIFTPLDGEEEPKSDFHRVSTVLPY